ncbi:MAG: ASCH domain-containing protein [bacterium]
MANKIAILKFRAVNKDIFEAIRDGRKKIETRAGTEKYRDIKAGDTLVLVCGKKNFEKKVKRVQTFRSIAAMLKRYKVKDIDPRLKTKEELEKIYHSFPNYREKIKKYGLIAFGLE